MTWANATNLAIVTPNIVYHSDLNAQETHSKILDRYIFISPFNLKFIIQFSFNKNKDMEI